MIALLLALAALAAPADPGEALVAQHTYEGALPGPVESLPWWRSLEDPQLQALVEEGLAANGDFATAVARVRQAEAQAQTALAPLLPSLSVGVSANVAPFDSLGFQFGGLPVGPGLEETPSVYYTGSALVQGQLGVDLAAG